MKRNIFWPLGMLLVAAVIIYLVADPNATGELKDIRVEGYPDTGKVTMVFMATNEDQMTLKLKGEDWYVDDSILAREPAVESVLEAVSRMKVKSPVPKAVRNQVVRNLAATGVKTEVYAGNEKVRTFYVGGATPDNYGTYMIAENAKEPYIMHIPGFDGFMSPRFSLNREDWISKRVFEIKPEEINVIKVDYPEYPSWGFKFTKYDTLIDVETATGNSTLDLNLAAIKSYFALFRNKYFDGFPPFLAAHPEIEDSIKQTTPYCVIWLKKYNGESKTLKVWNKPSYVSSTTTFDENGEMPAQDPERKYAQIERVDNLVHIQMLTFGNLFKKYEDFLLKQ